jgi:EAL domain-containing protein (putative c-di-GMP-specific phosphodiesterase class I)/GGDEF domain-containing protein
MTAEPVAGPATPFDSRQRGGVFIVFRSLPLYARFLAILAIVLLEAMATWVVYTTGGVKYSYVHLMYVPVIFAALLFDAPGAIVAGIGGALLLGPLMPVDTSSGEIQSFSNWIYRGAFFCLIGSIVGAGASTLRRQVSVLTWLNEHDFRTGLLDHLGLIAASRQMISQGGDGFEASTIVVQMNNLLDIQNTFGPEFGEKLIKHVCDRGRRLMPKQVPIALIQPDRVALTFPGGHETRPLRREIESKIREPYHIDGIPVYVDFTFGAAEYPAHANTVEELLQKASIAMHTAVTNKRPFFLYDSAADKTSRDNIMLLGMIPAAMANNEFMIWHQAKASLATGEITSTEALLRWVHPRRGLIPPGLFIPQVEESALINDLTRWVIQAALADKARWTGAGRSMGISINLSVRNLHDHSLLGALHETVSQHGIPPEQVELEITEGAVMHDFAYCGQLVSQLRDRGYRVSIDDFGTGHSSLAYLKKLPVSALKIDQAFVKNLAKDTNDYKIVRTIIALAKSFGLESVAEGVEDTAAYNILRNLGCDYVQGFGLQHPMPYDRLMAWLLEHKPTVPHYRET